MNLQQIKHRHDARTAYRIRQRQAWEDGYSRARSEPGYWPDDDWDDVY